MHPYVDVCCYARANYGIEFIATCVRLTILQGTRALAKTASHRQAQIVQSGVVSSAIRVTAGLLSTAPKTLASVRR